MCVRERKRYYIYRERETKSVCEIDRYSERDKNRKRVNNTERETKSDTERAIARECLSERDSARDVRYI